MVKFDKEHLEAIEDEIEALSMWKGGLWNWF